MRDLANKQGENPVAHRRFLLPLLLVVLMAAACTTQPESTATDAAPTEPPAAPTSDFPTPTVETLSAIGSTPEAQEGGTADSIDLTPPTLGAFDPAAVAGIDVSDYPIMPTVTAHARAIYRRGLADGRVPQRFSKIGDCMTAAEAFLTPFGGEDYDLGDFADLQPVIDYYGSVPARGEGFAEDSFANPGLSTASGFNSASVLDPTWSDPNWCSPGETPLACEYRVSRPSLAIIMFGTNDTFYLEAELFDFHLRNVVLATINSNVVPVLNTFPTRPEFPEKSVLFNQIIIQVAEDYDLPLVNLWLALEDVPGGGVDMEETIHLTVPEDGNTGLLDETHLLAGYTFRNLITLQALDVMRTGLAGEDA